MVDLEAWPSGVDAESLAALSQGHHGQNARAWRTREAGGTS
jgi:hypothetical protein